MEDKNFEELERVPIKVKEAIAQSRKICKPRIFTPIVLAIFALSTAFIIVCGSDSFLNLSQIYNKIIVSVLLLVICIISIILHSCKYNLRELKNSEELLEKQRGLILIYKNAHNKKVCENHLLKSFVKVSLPPEVLIVLEDEISKMNRGF